MRISVIFLACLLSTTTFAQKNSAYKFSIVFASCFQNDLVGLKLNETTLISSQEITSDPVSGITGLGAYQDNKGVCVTYKEQKKQHSLLTIKNEILLNITINGQPTIFNVDLKKGRIIFIDYCFEGSAGARKQKLTLRQHRKTVQLY